ncbi:MAG: hypothetical protein WDO56_06180 [Gammaproteobacteria bacterium]
MNNAGVKTLSPANSAKPEDWDNAVAVNFTAIYNGVRRLRAPLQGAQRRRADRHHRVDERHPAGGDGGHLHGNEVRAVGLMEGLRIEFEGTNIGTSCFCPGGVSTDNLAGGQPPATPRPRWKAAAEFRRGVDGSARSGRACSQRHQEPTTSIFSRIRVQGRREKSVTTALLASFTDEEAPAARLPLEARTRHTGIYPRELAHRSVKRKTYRG